MVDDNLVVVVAEAPAPEEDEPKKKPLVDPETGEIDWDCPCLGAATKGPCGEPFKLAFSCYVSGNTEDTRASCVSPFLAWGSCQRANPPPDADSQAPPANA